MGKLDRDKKAKNKQLEKEKKERHKAIAEQKKTQADKSGESSAQEGPVVSLDTHSTTRTTSANSNLSFGFSSTVTISTGIGTPSTPDNFQSSKEELIKDRTGSFDCTTDISSSVDATHDDIGLSVTTDPIPYNKEESLKNRTLSEGSMADTRSLDATPADSGISLAEHTRPMSAMDFFKEKCNLPVRHSWTLYRLLHGAGDVKDKEDFFKNMKQVCDVSTVGEFAWLINSIKAPTDLVNADYYFFRKGIEPTWEDEANKNGGSWTIEFGRATQKRGQEVNEIWYDILMLMVGNKFEPYGEHICGLVFRWRNKGHRIALWTRDSENFDACKRIGHALVEQLISRDYFGLLNLQTHKEPTERKIFLPYLTHKEAQKRTGSRFESKYGVFLEA